MQLLPGFRDFYPEDCARRNYILTCWRTVSRRYGFVEYDGPAVESLALFEKKSGGELVGQMFTVGATADPGVLKGVLRPEMTPTLARMLVAREREFKKPMKWFSVPNCFRHERPGRGRLREFYQLNCDILGEISPAADAELIAVTIDTLREFGLGPNDFMVRISSRQAWQEFFLSLGGKAEQEYEFFQVVDKAERMPEPKLRELLSRFEIELEPVFAFMASKEPTADLIPIVADLTARGLGAYLEVDYKIIRGLAYYTGVVFEAFDRSLNERSLAGGGRYDKLLSLMSDKKSDLPALGFGMGDVVLANLIDDVPSAKARMDRWLAENRAAEIYVVIANEDRRPEALGLIQKLRDSNYRVDYPLTPAKVGKQFQTAEHVGATVAILVGEEWPALKVKLLSSREEVFVEADDLSSHLGVWLETRASSAA